MRRFRVLITGGGTGGHVYPALAVAAGLRSEAEILYVGTAGGLEARLARESGIPFREIRAGGVIGKSAIGKAAGLAAAWYGFWQSLAILRRFRPDVVVGTGGYVSGPVLLAAVARGFPVLIQEQNLRPGLTNRLLSRFARAVSVPYPESREYLPRAARPKAVVIGNPVRPALWGVNAREAKKELGLDSERVVLLFGGSGGARRLNEAALDLAPTLKPGEILLWATGPRYFKEFESRLGGLGLPPGRVRILPYIDRMEIFLPAADIVICRAGAMTMAEVLALGKPAILVPSPNVAHDHQRQNARLAAARGAALLLEEEELGELPKLLRELLEEPGRREELAAAARRLAGDDALPRLLAEVRRVVTGGRSD